MKKYYIRKGTIKMNDDCFDGAYTRVTRRTFEKWLKVNTGLVEIMYNDNYSEYFKHNHLIAFTTPLLTI